MRSINYSPPPAERIPDLEACGILKDYELQCDEYPGAYIMSQFMDKIPDCDFSRPQDDFYLKDGIIYSNWIVFFTCRPRDAMRLAFIARRIGYPIHIKSYGLEDLV